MKFDELFRLVVLTERGILERVDEYTLYCHYTSADEILLGKAYCAPYREDKVPSFCVYASKREGVEYLWKDHATGESGSIFNLIQKIEGLNSLEEVYSRINVDFNLGFSTENPPIREKINLYARPEPTNIKIRILDQPYTKAGQDFWNQFRVEKDLLDFFNTQQVKYYWSFEEQQAPTEAPDPMFSYRTGGYYQLYSPFAPKQYKFRNDLPEGYFFGYLQLPKTGDVLVIDKSCKDVIFCRRLGFYAVCGKSETTMIPDRKMLELKERFKEVYIMLDDDEAGHKQTKKYTELYPWLKPRFLWAAKDKTDLCIKLGFDEAERLIKETIK